jgi:hypothetical protein
MQDIGCAGVLLYFKCPASKHLCAPLTFTDKWVRLSVILITIRQLSVNNVRLYEHIFLGCSYIGTYRLVTVAVIDNKQ